MRAIKTTTISILVLGLLVGSAVGVAAQDGEAAEITSFTGKLWFETVARESTDTDLGNGFTEYLDFVVLNGIESDDPRFTGDHSVVINTVMVPDSMETASQIATTHLVTTDEGSWLGEGRMFSGAGMDSSGELIVFVGQGGYEGLAAYARIDNTQSVPEISGAIFPTAMPEAPEPYVAE